MTLRQWAEEFCIKKLGLSQGVAKVVVEQAMVDSSNAAMSDRWESDVSGYTTPVLTTVAKTLQHQVKTVTELLSNAAGND